MRERATHDYRRAGTSSLCAALDIASGQVIGSLHARHRAIEFKKFLQTIDREVPADLDGRVVSHMANHFPGDMRSPAPLEPWP